MKGEVRRFKDMACLTMLLKLERRGLIELPARQKASVNNRRSLNFQPMSHDKTEIHGDLKDIAPIAVRNATRVLKSCCGCRCRMNITALGSQRELRKSIACLVSDLFERPVAALLFKAAAWKVASRDRFIGWSTSQRKKNLKFIANNMRFPIPP